MDLSERKKKILSAVINEYIRTGEPVGSKALMGLEDLLVSSATIRNEMSDLEEMGYLMKPHTSAGRIPSNEGYRYYVKTSLNPYNLTPLDIAQLSMHSSACAGLNEIIKETAARLASFSGCTVFAVSPISTGGVFTFEVMPSGKRTLAIMAIGSNGGVKTCFAKTSRDITPEDSSKLTKVFNSVLSGFSVDKIGKVRMLLLESEIKKTCSGIIENFDTVNRLMQQLQSYELCISGSANLLAYPEFSSIEVARQYIELLSKHEYISDVLLKDTTPNDIVIKIGSENKIFANPNASTVSQGCNSKVPVILGLMGPTRMDYARIKAGFGYIMKLLKDIIDEEF